MRALSIAPCNSVRLVVLACTLIASICDAGQSQDFRAGAVCVDITPTQLPSIIAGNFLEAQSSQISDRLYVRAIVLADGTTTIALVVVDTCMMPQSLIDEAKKLAQQRCSIAVDKIMVSATHTHSAPAAMSCLGTRVDKTYAATLPDKIAEAIASAHSKLEPAQVGWSSIDDWQHTHNRRWIRKPEKKVVDPFGQPTGLAHMHPGYQSADVIGPSGPVDPAISVLSVQSRSGQPLAVLANYSQHYFASQPVSADYFGHFSRYVAELLHQPGQGNGPFVCAMSQGTSGDAMWMDYGSPSQTIPLERYAEAVARYAEEALLDIQYHADATLAMAEKRIPLKYRVPDEQRLAWARPIAEGIENDVPKSLPEVYAREAVILHQRQSTEITLQAIRIGELTMAALPNEVYSLTGLKLKGRAPTTSHFNIELANGAEGYIPPPEQHTLGGYTTWPARTAGLQPEAEPIIVDTLVEALESVTGLPRRTMTDTHGDYAQAILAAQPVAYYRLNDEDGRSPRNSVNSNAGDGGIRAQLSDGFAWYLPGVDSGTGTGDGQELTASAFSGPYQINRAVHLAGGVMTASLPRSSEDSSIAFWFWLGEPSGASERSGTLCAVGDARLIAHQFADHTVQLEIGDQVTQKHWAADQWHLAVIVREGTALRVTVDGSAEPVLEFDVAKLSSKDPARSEAEDRIEFGANMQGKLDEVALFDRALKPADIVHFWKNSRMEKSRERVQAVKAHADALLTAEIKTPDFPPAYAEAIRTLRPHLMESLAVPPRSLDGASGSVGFSTERYATFQTGRLSGRSQNLPAAYSVALWFRNALSNDTRPVTAYIFSRGVNADPLAPGDHLGIGGNYRPGDAGKLMFFNGNTRDQVITGPTVLLPNTWNHVVLVRDAQRVRAYLNGQISKPEIDADVEITFGDSDEFYLGARSDQFAPLIGSLAHFALFDRALLPEEAQQLYRDSGQSAPSHAGTAEASSKPTMQPLPPLSIDQSIAKIHVPKGFRIELVAAEPEVIDPVAMDWDSAGRLFVVEMRDYPLGMDGQGKPGGRVRLLQDLNGDGRFETSQVYADDLNFPNGILTWRDGVLVTAAPQILFLRDTDGDGLADVREVLFDGFQQGNQQLRLNGLRWGIDNWVYCANGGHHADYGIGTQVTSTRNGKAYELGSRDFRFQPDSGELVLESGPSQFGRNRDAWGHWFGTQNAKPLWHYVIADRYLARNPFVPTGSPIQFVLPPGSPPVYPASTLEKRFHSFQEAGHFTSACGSMIYGDSVLFRSEPERSHALTCEPFHNLIQHNILSEDGVSFRADRPAGEGRFDFFASQERWSRPVMARTGPDGAVWVADMMRYMIEHPDWLPVEGKAELLPHYRLGDDLGRIYRIVPSAKGTKDTSDVQANWSFEDTSTVALVAELNSSNSWRRDKAQQMLLWSGDREAVPLLEHLAGTSPSALARLQAICTLDGLQALSDLIIVQALADSEAGLREHGLRLAELHPSPPVIAAAIALVDDVSPKVCLQLALTLGQWDSEPAARALVHLAERFSEDEMMKSAIMSSALTHAGRFAEGMATAKPATLAAFREPLARQAAGSRDSKVVEILLASALTAAEAEQFDALDGLLSTLQQLGTSCRELAAFDRTDSQPVHLERLVSLLETTRLISDDVQRDPDVRVAAATLLCRTAEHRDAGVDRLSEWLNPQVDPALQSQVLTVLSETNDPRIPSILSRVWSELSPSLRSQALDVWLARAAWTTDLIERLEIEEIKVSSLDLSQRARLQHYPSVELATRAERLFHQSAPSPRNEVVDRFRPALKLANDQRRGHEVFMRTCASCHRRGSEGFDVGPNLATVIQHSGEKLLVNVLNPNTDIQPGYQTYTCLLENGEILSGILVGETANSITIKQAGAVTRTIARREVEMLKNTNVSFMPEGLEASLSPQELADLIAFLQQPL